jgi:hypothetical protein
VSRPIDEACARGSTGAGGRVDEQERSSGNSAGPHSRPTAAEHPELPNQGCCSAEPDGPPGHAGRRRLGLVRVAYALAEAASTSFPACRTPNASMICMMPLNSAKKPTQNKIRYVR